MSSPGYWTCGKCYGRNVQQLQYCVVCDSARSDVESHGAPYVQLAHASPSLWSPHPNRGENTPPLAPRASHGRLSFEGQYSHPRYSPSPSRDDERYALQQQLDDALRSHSQLLQQYQNVASALRAKEADVELLGAEVAAQRQQLVKERDLRHGAEENFMSELAARERIITVQKEQIDAISAERDRLLDRLQNASIASAQNKAMESSSTVQALTAKERELASNKQQLEGLQERHSEALATVTKLTRELEDLRTRETSIKQDHSSDIQRVLRDALASNEAVIEKITKDLMESKAAIERNADRERGSLQAQIQQLSHDALMVKDEHAKALKRVSDYAEQTQAAYDKLVQQREELLSEAKFQLEIISDLKAEKAGLQAEANTLREAMSVMPLPEGRRAASMSLSRPSLVNISQNNGAGVLQSELPDQHDMQQSKALQEALDEANGKLQSLTFEVNELRKQLVRAQEALKDRDEDLEEAIAAKEDLERKLEQEKQFNASAQGDLDTLEAKLQARTSELNERLEALVQQNKDLAEQNIVLREKADATDIAMHEMEQVLADALARDKDKKREAATERTEPRPPVNVVTQPSQEELDDQEKDRLLKDFTKDSRAMKALSIAQRRMKSSKAS